MNKLNLTSGEQEVMGILWEYGELKPSEIQDLFPREIKNPALRSYLSILHEKGHVTRRQDGKAYRYKAKTRRSNALQHKLRELVDVYCKGSTRSLLFNLAESEELSDEDIQALKAIRDKGKAKGKKQNG